MRSERGQLTKQAITLAAAFAHADDPSTADCNACPADASERREPILISSRSDDFAVEFGGRVEVVIVCGEPRFRERASLCLRQHAQRAAGLQTQLADAANHREHALERFALGDVT